MKNEISQISKDDQSLNYRVFRHMNAIINYGLYKEGSVQEEYNLKMNTNDLTGDFKLLKMRGQHEWVPKVEFYLNTSLLRNQTWLPKPL